MTLFEIDLILWIFSSAPFLVFNFLNILFLKVGTCSSNPTYVYLTRATKAGFAHVYPHGDETALVNAVATIGPICKILFCFKIFEIQKIKQLFNYQSL